MLDSVMTQSQDINRGILSCPSKAKFSCMVFDCFNDSSHGLSRFLPNNKLRHIIVLLAALPLYSPKAHPVVGQDNFCLFQVEFLQGGTRTYLSSG